MLPGQPTPPGKLSPHQLRSGLKNFSNLMFLMPLQTIIMPPSSFEPDVEFGRFIINTTSSAGFADVAKGHKTVCLSTPRVKTLVRLWGVGALGTVSTLCGPFLAPARRVTPLAGRVILRTLFYLQPTELALGIGGSLRFNALGDVLPLYEDLNTVAVDPYIAMREAYVNFRKAQVMH